MITRRFRWLRSVGVALAALILLASSAMAAETVHLYLKVDGRDILGESTQLSLGRENSIECVKLEQAVSAPANEGGKASFGPITCVKRIDRSTPFLIRALVKGEPVTATFKFFRPNPIGDGTTEQFYTIEIAGARITGYRMYVPDTLTPETTNMPPQEEITFTYRSATWTYVNGDISFEAQVKEPEKEQKPADAGGYNLKAEAEGNGWILLNWSELEAAKGKLMGYDVYRSTDSMVMTTERNRILDLPIEKTTVRDRAVPGTYYYVVQAVLKDGTRLDPSPAVMVIVK